MKKKTIIISAAVIICICLLGASVFAIYQSNGKNKEQNKVAMAATQESQSSDETAKEETAPAEQSKPEVALGEVGKTTEVSAEQSKEAETAESKAPAQTTKEPVTSAAPEATKAPAATPNPSKEQGTAATEQSKEAEQPEATTKPTAAPKPAATPEPTKKPAQTITPKPVATATPKPTAAPVHTCSFDSGKTTREATCNSEGEITYSCSCGKTKTESISKTSHNYVAQTTEPTCTEAGSTAQVCANCGDTKAGSSVSALGHDYEKEYPMGDNTDCRGGSYYVVSCSRCGDVKESGHDDALPHDFEEEVVFEGDCVRESVIELTCKNCGFSKREGGSTTDDHNWVTKQDVPTVDMETGLLIPGEEVTQCSRCGARQ